MVEKKSVFFNIGLSPMSILVFSPRSVWIFEMRLFCNCPKLLWKLQRKPIIRKNFSRIRVNLGVRYSGLPPIDSDLVFFGEIILKTSKAYFNKFFEPTKIRTQMKIKSILPYIYIYGMVYWYVRMEVKHKSIAQSLLYIHILF